MKVQCAICEKLFLNVNNKHLASHNLTVLEYKERFPASPLMSEEHAAKLSARSIASNLSRKGVPRTAEERQKMRDGQARYHASHPDLTRDPMSEEQRQLLSELARERYTNGFVHPNLGKHHSESIKRKISASLTGRVVGPEPARKAVETKRRHGYDMAPMRGKTHTAATKAVIGEKSAAFHRRERPVLREGMLARMAAANVTLLNDLRDDVFRLRCHVCGYKFTRTPQQFQPSKFHTEICDQCFPISPISQQENEVAEYIAQLTDTRIVRSDMEVLAPLEIDILLPELKLAIEYCGIYYHSDKHRYYHRHKYEACLRQDIRLITIFEDEWLNCRPIVESMLRNALGGSTRTMHARACHVTEISSHEANEFLRANHLQGRGRSKVRLGLWHDAELVAVMTFMDADVSRHRVGWEINRFCSKLGCSIRGAASKLFSVFVASHDPTEVTSYADLRWGNGKVYERLGFQHVGNTVPGYWYVKNGKRMHRFALRKTTADPAEVTEKNLRTQQGWRILWDCGHARWVWLANPMGQAAEAWQ